MTHPSSSVKPVAILPDRYWVCTKRTDGDRRVFDRPECVSNYEYVKAHPRHDWVEYCRYADIEPIVRENERLRKTLEIVRDTLPHVNGASERSVDGLMKSISDALAPSTSGETT
jgi:hypothetical protein